jgi:double-GTPase-like protein
MTDRKGARLALVGLPNTGKTTYLAALWNALQENTTDHSLRLVRYPSNGAYLSSIHESWLRGEVVGHTPRDGGEHVELQVEIDGQSVALSIPDVSGESFEDVIIRRQVDTVVDGLLTTAHGILVFAHPDHLRPRITIAQARKMGAMSEATSEPKRTGPLNRLLLPAEMHIVDLLQAIQLRCRSEGGPDQQRVAVIVSAWDLLQQEGLSPVEWVEGRMPMLHGYLTCTLTNRYQVFGISAQGGPAGTDMAEKDPATKARVVEPNGEEHGDITKPIVWAANLT